MNKTQTSNDHMVERLLTVMLPIARLMFVVSLAFMPGLKLDLCMYL